MARWAMMVIGDTQYLFDGERARPDLLAAAFVQARALAAALDAGEVLHVVHVGDVTEHGDEAECELAATTILDGCRLLGAGLTVVAGNHDIDQRTGDDRGPTPFLRRLGARGWLRTALGPLSQDVRADPTGYSTWQLLTLPGGGTGGEPGRLAVLGLDWRPGPQTLRWALERLEECRQVPTVVVCHDVARHRRTDQGAPCGPGELTGHGRRLAMLLAGQEQVFLVLAGHEWPSTVASLDGTEVHVVNYQDLPLGGAGAARLYCFDTERGTCEVVSFSPGLQDPQALRSVAVRRRLSLSRPEDQRRLMLPAALGGGRGPWQAAGLELVAELGEEELARVTELEAGLPGHYVIELRMRVPRSMPRHWEVMVCRLAGPAGAPDGSPEPLAALSLSTEAFVGWQAYTVAEPGAPAACTWQTSHEVELGSDIEVLVAGGGEVAGLWVDGDRVGRDDGRCVAPLVDGPWRWRLGAGEYGGEPADTASGRLVRVRVWGERPAGG